MDPPEYSEGEFDSDSEDLLDEEEEIISLEETDYEEVNGDEVEDIHESDGEEQSYDEISMDEDESFTGIESSAGSQHRRQPLEPPAEEPPKMEPLLFQDSAVENLEDRLKSLNLQQQQTEPPGSFFTAADTNEHEHEHLEIETVISSQSDATGFKGTPEPSQWKNAPTRNHFERPRNTLSNLGEQDEELHQSRTLENDEEGLQAPPDLEEEIAVDAEWEQEPDPRKDEEPQKLGGIIIEEEDTVEGKNAEEETDEIYVQEKEKIMGVVVQEGDATLHESREELVPSQESGIIWENMVQSLDASTENLHASRDRLHASSKTNRDVLRDKSGDEDVENDQKNVKDTRILEAVVTDSKEKDGEAAVITNCSEPVSKPSSDQSVESPASSRPSSSALTSESPKSKPVPDHSLQSPTPSRRSSALSFESPKPKPIPKPRDPEPSIMHELVEKHQWQKLLMYMGEQLRKEPPGTIAYELTKTDTTRRATVVHRVVATAPMTLTKLLISIVPFGSRRDIFLQLDKEGNTPLHLACAALSIQSKSNTLDDAIIKTLTVGAPDAHDIRNHGGDIPLSLLLTSPAMKAAVDPTREDLLVVESQAQDLLRCILHDRSDLASTQNRNGQTLLHVGAAHRVHERVLMELVEFVGFACDLSDSQGHLPLHYAASVIAGPFPPVSFVERLLATGPEGLTTQCGLGNTPLHFFLSSIRNNIANEEDRSSFAIEQMAEALLGRSSEEAMCPLLVKNKDGLTPLHCCALYASPISVIRILMHSPFFLKAAQMTDNHSFTPFHFLCASSVVSSLVEHILLLGTIEASIKKDGKGRTPMHIAVENLKCTIDALQAIIDINPKAAAVENLKGRMPLHVAIQKKAPEVILKVLLQAYPKAVKAVFEEEHGVFHEMCQLRIPANVIRAILQYYPEGAQQANHLKNLPLHVAAAYHCDLPTIKALVKAFPEACMRQNKHKDVPLHYAMGAKHSTDEVIQFLVTSAPASVMVQNEKNLTPVDQARKFGLESVLSEALQAAETKKNKKRTIKHLEEHIPPPSPAPLPVPEGQECKVRVKVLSKAAKSQGAKSPELKERRSRSKSRDHSTPETSNINGRTSRSKSRDIIDEKNGKNQEKSVGKSVNGTREGRSVKQEKAEETKSRRRSKSADISGSKQDGDGSKRKVKKDFVKSAGHIDHDPSDAAKSKSFRRTRSVSPSRAGQNSSKDLLAGKDNAKKIKKSLERHKSMDNDLVSPVGKSTKSIGKSFRRKSKASLALEEESLPPTIASVASKHSKKPKSRIVLQDEEKTHVSPKKPKSISMLLTDEKTPGGSKKPKSRSMLLDVEQTPVHRKKSRSKSTVLPDLEKTPGSSKKPKSRSMLLDIEQTPVHRKKSRSTSMLLPDLEKTPGGGNKPKSNRVLLDGEQMPANTRKSRLKSMLPPKIMLLDVEHTPVHRTKPKSKSKLLLDFEQTPGDKKNKKKSHKTAKLSKGVLHLDDSDELSVAMGDSASSRYDDRSSSVASLEDNHKRKKKKKKKKRSKKVHNSAPSDSSEGSSANVSLTPRSRKSKRKVKASNDPMKSKQRSSKSLAVLSHVNAPSEAASPQTPRQSKRETLVGELVLSPVELSARLRRVSVDLDNEDEDDD